MPISFSPEANTRARKPLLNTDPTTIYGASGKAPSTQEYALGLAVATRLCGTTATSATVTCTDTSGLAVGMVAGGAGVSAGQAATTQNTGETFTINGHGFPNGTPVYLTALGTTTGFSLNKLYYVISTATNTFQLAATPGGSALPVDADGTATVVGARFITAITTDTSFTLSAPATATNASNVLQFYLPEAVF